MKKIIPVFLSAMLLLALITGCGGNTEKQSDGEKTEDKLTVVATIFPEYDWAREVIGENADNVELTLLLDSGVDLHNYQPTADDILTISGCDMFIYVGGESDSWTADALKQAANKDMVVVNLLEELGSSAKEEEIVEGMQDDGHEHEDEEHADAEEHEYDEHVWLSLKNAETFCKTIAEKLAEIDPENGDSYKKNAEAYTEKLRELDGRYEKMVAGAQTKTLLFGDRFPFRYLIDDYGLTYYAAFSGCAAETEASFETVRFLAEKVDELGLKHVVTIEGTEHSIAETIISNTETKDQDILTMNSMQSVTEKDVANGVKYLNIMEEDLAVLEEALN